MINSSNINLGLSRLRGSPDFLWHMVQTQVAKFSASLNSGVSAFPAACRLQGASIGASIISQILSSGPSLLLSAHSWFYQVL